MADANTRYAILGLIAARPEGIHGYELKKDIEALSGRDFWEINFGSLYRLLDALDSDGQIEALLEESARSQRQVYRITEKGRRSLDDWLLQPVADSPRPLRDELALKLIFLDPRRLDVLGEQLRAQRSIYMAQLSLLVRNQRRLERAGLKPSITRLVMEGAEMRLRADLAWLDVVERKLLRMASL
jgi:DNA-binding PadR family transcriptional regulator